MHVRIGWVHVRLFGAKGALTSMRVGIRRLNEVHGVPNTRSSGYHETITRLWIALIDEAQSNGVASPQTSESFLRTNPELKDFGLTYRHYRKSTLQLAGTRRHWVPPDLMPLS